MVLDILDGLRGKSLQKALSFSFYCSDYVRSMNFLFNKYL